MKKTVLMAGMVMTALMTAAGAVDATPSLHNIYVDGVKTNIAAYEIADNNYFKLRDMAAILAGTDAQFEVTWNGTANRIDLTADKAYTSVGGELGAIPTGTQTASPSTASLYKDGRAVAYTGYEVNNNNYYKLRDVAASFDFNVTWDGTNQRVNIVTTEGYVPEGQKPTKPEAGFVDLKGEPSEEWLAVLEENAKNGERAGLNLVYPPDTYEITFTFDVQTCEEYSTTPLPYADVYIGYRKDKATPDQYFGKYQFSFVTMTTLVTDSKGKATCTVTIPWEVYGEILDGNGEIYGMILDHKTGDLMLGGSLDKSTVQLLGKTSNWSQPQVPKPMVIN